MQKERGFDKMLTRCNLVPENRKVGLISGLSSSHYRLSVQRLYSRYFELWTKITPEGPLLLFSIRQWSVWCQQMTDDRGNPSAKDKKEEVKAKKERTCETKMQLESHSYFPCYSWFTATQQAFLFSGLHHFEGERGKCLYFRE